MGNHAYMLEEMCKFFFTMLLLSLSIFRLPSSGQKEQKVPNSDSKSKISPRFFMVSGMMFSYLSLSPANISWHSKTRLSRQSLGVQAFHSKTISFLLRLEPNTLGLFLDLLRSKLLGPSYLENCSLRCLHW